MCYAYNGAAPHVIWRVQLPDVVPLISRPDLQITYRLAAALHDKLLHKLENKAPESYSFTPFTVQI